MGIFNKSKKYSDEELVKEISNMSSFLKEKNLQTTKDLKSLQKYFDKCPFIYTLIDEDTRVKKYNYLLKKKLNLSHTSLINGLLTRDIHPDDVDDFKQYIEILKKEERSMVSRIVSTHGESYTIKWHGMYLEDEELYLLFGEDITKEVQLNAQVRDTIRYKNVVLDNYPGGMVCVNKYGKIVEFNKRSEELSGYTRGEIMRRHIYDVFPKKNLFSEDNLNIMQKVKLNRNDMRNTEVYLSINPMYDNSQLIGYIGVFYSKKDAKAIKSFID